MLRPDVRRPERPRDPLGVQDGALGGRGERRGRLGGLARPGGGVDAVAQPAGVGPGRAQQGVDRVVVDQCVEEVDHVQVWRAALPGHLQRPAQRLPGGGAEQPAHVHALDAGPRRRPALHTAEDPARQLLEASERVSSEE